MKVRPSRRTNFRLLAPASGQNSWTSRGSTSNSFKCGVLSGMHALIWCEACGTHLAIDQFSELPWECSCGEIVAAPVTVMVEESQELILNI